MPENEKQGKKSVDGIVAKISVHGSFKKLNSTNGQCKSNGNVISKNYARRSVKHCNWTNYHINKIKFKLKEFHIYDKKI